MNSPTATVRKIRDNFSSLHDLMLFIRIFSLITVLPAMLRLCSIPGIMTLLTPRCTTPSRNPYSDKVQKRIVKYTDYILCRNFWIYKSTCLRRSLILYHFLRRAGVNVQVCLGVRYTGKLPQGGSSKELEGHAWLLYKGEIFLERNADMAKTYAVTYRFPERERWTEQEGIPT